jgi:hypothetical protein
MHTCWLHFDNPSTPSPQQASSISVIPRRGHPRRGEDGVQAGRRIGETMSDDVAKSNSAEVSREDRIQELLAVAINKLKDSLFFSVSGVTTVRLPNGTEYELHEEAVRDWLTDLGYEHAFRLREPDLKYMVRVLRNRAREKSRTGDPPLAIIKRLQGEPLYVVLEAYMQGTDKLTVLVSKLYEALTKKAETLKNGITRQKRWPKSDAVMSRYLRAQPELLSAVGLAVTWNDTKEGMKVSITHRKEQGDPIGADASPDASPAKSNKDRVLRQHDALGAERVNELDQLRKMMKRSTK